MGKAIYNQDALLHYLLGYLPDKDVELFDEWSIDDDEFACALAATENDLVDAYVRGELTGSTQEKFRAAYLTSDEKLQKVAFARSFLNFCEREVDSDTAGYPTQPAVALLARRSKFSIGNIFDGPRLMHWGVAATIVVFLAVVWFAYNNLRLRRQTSDKQVATEVTKQTQQDAPGNLTQGNDQEVAGSDELTRLRQEGERSERELSKEKQVSNTQQLPTKRGLSPVGQANIASFVLAPQVRGNGKIRTLSLPARTTMVGITLQLEPNDYSSYRVALLSESSEVLWRSNKIKARETSSGKTLNVTFTGKLLGSGVFFLQLYGVDANKSETLSTYPFKVVE